jgi:multidrug efflux pump subunit AcrB
LPLMEAIFEGGHRRLKSIIMITLTSIGALAPTLWMSDLGSELQKPLALALIGGMTVGLLISLFFVPLVYWFVYRKKENV